MALVLMVPLVLEGYRVTKTGCGLEESFITLLVQVSAIALCATLFPFSFYSTDLKCFAINFL